MQNTLRQAPGETNQTLFGYFLVMVVAATTALIFSLVAGLSWQVSLMLMAGAAVLMCGIYFTVVEILRLRPRRASRQNAAVPR